MKILLRIDTILDGFPKNPQFWEFHHAGIYGVVVDCLMMADQFLPFSDKMTKFPQRGMTCLGDHLVWSYDTWVEDNVDPDGFTTYEFQKRVGELELVGQLLQDVVESQIKTIFKHPLSKLKVKHARLIGDSAILLEI